MKRLIRGEKGYVLIAALLVLVVLGLIAGPLLSYMVSGLKAGHTFETGAAELYAADAGVQDAVWKIQNNIGPCSGNATMHYIITDVNGKSVDVTIVYQDGGTYKITSTAVTDKGGNTAALGSHTTVEAYVGVTTTIGSGFLDNAITSNGTVTIGSNSIVTGNVTYGTGISGNSSSTLYGTATQGSMIWPTASELSDFYLSQVDPNNPGPNNIDLSGGTVHLGPSYINGDLSVSGKAGTLKLMGTVYVNGNVAFSQSGNNGYTVDLNGQTIFAMGYISLPSNHITVTGSGCIIAVGYINFQPGIMTSTDFVFVMSVSSYVNFQPNGTFCGSVAGNVYVNLRSNNTLTWHSLRGTGTTLNVPASISGAAAPTMTGTTIISYDVSRQ